MRIKSGIYCIMNTVNSKKYVGSSIDISSRWTGHRYELRRGTHKNTHLQSAWNKYGEQAFVFYVLEEVIKERRVDLYPYEDKHILELDTLNPDKGYNMELAGNKIKMSVDCKRVFREIISLDREGNIIKEYPSIMEASRDLGVKNNVIDAILNSRSLAKSKGKIKKSYKGISFIYKDSYDPTKSYKYITYKKVRIMQLDLDMNPIREFESGVEASEVLNLPLRRIHYCMCQGSRTGGFYFRRIEKDGTYNTIKKGDIPNINKSKRVKVEYNEGVLNFINIYEGMKYFNIDKSKVKIIKKCIRKNYRAYGMKWSYVEE